MMNTPMRSTQILKRLIILAIITVVVVIFAYGWTVTDIDLAVPQEPQRQQNVGKALRELFAPNVFTQDYIVSAYTANFRITCSDAEIIPPNPPSNEPYIVVEPTCADGDDTVTVHGYNFPANGLARMNWIAADGERRIRQVDGTDEDNFSADDDGTFSIQIQVPRIRGSSGEIHQIEAQGRFPVGLPRFSDTTNLVMEKMIETIFLALIATAVSILPSAVLSFMAAHNLMRPIRAQFGSLMVSFTLLPVGWVLGVLLLKPIGEFAFYAGSENGTTALIGVIIVVVEAIVLWQGLGYLKSLLPFMVLRRLLNTSVIVIGIISVLGLMGGLGVLFQRTFTEGIFIHLGALIGSLGQIIEFSLEILAGLIGAFAFSSLGASLTKELLKNTDTTFNHLLGGLLGALGGAILLGMTSTIGLSASWVGLLTPIIAGVLATTILPQAYRWFVPKPEVPNPSDRNILRILAWVSGIMGFVFTFWILNVGQSLVEGLLPAQVTVLTIGGTTLYRYVAVSMVIGAVFGGIAGALGGVRGAFPLGSVIYNTTRTILNGLRSIEPLIMGLVFVIWVGIGPFAGVLALALHSIASLGKLYSEQIESIDAGPIEALQSTGANRLQTIMYAVVPQIIPPYIAFTMYRWDINVRMSTIIGFVGGGGVGFLLQQQINLLQYRNAGVAVLAIAIVVSILDYASAAIRERYT
ncbi:MAG: ABC transporter permease subunit [bacterium]|nr:ABC transporter permease subunit [bacterium]